MVVFYSAICEEMPEFADEEGEMGRRGGGGKGETDGGRASAGAAS